MAGRRIPLASFNPDEHADGYRSPTTALTPMAADLIDEINNALDSDDYEWASDTLEGIKESIERRLDCTEGQRRAVRNILDGRR